MYVAPLVKLSATTAEARIFVNVNGVFTLLNSSVIPFTGAGKLRFEVVQNSLRVYVNGSRRTGDQQHIHGGRARRHPHIGRRHCRQFR
jgi:hypothetical protein